MLYDIKDNLWQEIALKEKDFREALNKTNTETYANIIVAVVCSADAIVPMWAYMLIASLLQPVSVGVYFGNPEEAQKKHLLKSISEMDLSDYVDKRVVIKGCGDTPIGEAAYIAITQKLGPVVKSIMYGEPCSTVPVYKKK